MQDKPTYLYGFGNQHQSEAIEGALPLNRNNPQNPPLGLYAEQINGSAFTEPRQQNYRSWVYRAQPSAAHPPFTPFDTNNFHPNNLATIDTPNRFRWGPIPTPTTDTVDLVEGVNMLLINGQPQEKKGMAIYLFAANHSMHNRYFYNADGDWLIIPFEGAMILHTEFGPLELGVGEFALIPRGIKFRCEVIGSHVKGFIGENYGQPFRLPDLGPIGSNGLANARDFQFPTAHFEKFTNQQCELICKFNQKLWKTEMDHSPLNVVAWHGNLLPYKYNLRHFNTINSVSFDHPDPSIFTVLTAPTGLPGLANVDFVIFPERWMVAEDTFRPPYFHRNTMSEFLGLIYGEYDAKGRGFSPGGSSCHNCMMAHGPDVESYQKAITATLAPHKQTNTLAFMFESAWAYQPTHYALYKASRDEMYDLCWNGFKQAGC